MPLIGRPLFSTETLTRQDIELLFSRTQLFKSEFFKKRKINHLIHSQDVDQKVLSIAFFEASTRTRLSFQMAAHRLGMKSTSLENLSVSSISKGETYADTIRTLLAMQPDVLAVRYGDNTDLDEYLQEVKVPVVNGGSGTAEHPTQALLDAFTIQEFRGQVQGEKVLIVGDVLHSRVANSNLYLLTKMGAEVAYCAPEQYVPDRENWKSVKKFSDLKEAMNWATVCMCLRVQKERHKLHNSIGLSMAEYRERFRVGRAQLKLFHSQGILLHPGPVVRGIDVSSGAMDDPRSKILDQVQNGVFIRAALLSFILGLEVKTS